jgi:pyruvate, water dikinase
MGLTNTVVMIPFCRTSAEAERVLATMAEYGLRRGRNDLTQLTLGVDRDSARLAPLFDEREPAVTRSIQALIDSAHRRHRKVGLCGQRPSDDPDFARFLVRAGIDSISVTPDSFLAVKNNVAAAEHHRRHHRHHEQHQHRDTGEIEEKAR